MGRIVHVVAAAPRTKQVTSLSNLAYFLQVIGLVLTTTTTFTHKHTSVSALKSLDRPFQNEFKTLPQSPCVSLFHRNGRIGCGTYSHDTMTGRILHWSTLTTGVSSSNSNVYQYYTDLADAMPPFVAVVDEYEYTTETVSQIMAMNSNNNNGNNNGSSSNTKLVQGILILNSTISTNSGGTNYANSAPVSPRGQNTPSYQLTPDYDYEWNTNGDGLMLQDMYGVPSAYVNDAEIGDFILQSAIDQSDQFLARKDSSFTSSTSSTSSSSGIFSKNHFSAPPIQAEFDLYMGPETMDTATCLSWIDNDNVWRPKCLPLGGNSVWAKAGSPTVVSSNNNDDGNNNNNDNDKQSVVLVATNIDSTSMFHDMVPGANTAASNILTLLMAAKLIGDSLKDETLDGFNKQIVFAFFQGEQYGYIGSRSFLRDVAYPGFECDGEFVPTVSKRKDDENYFKKSCLSPLRHDLDFTMLGKIDGMIAVDQVGVLGNDQTFYVHDDGSNNDLSDIFQSMSSDDWTISEGSAGSIPPSPLSSLVSLSEGNAGGVVLSGYDDAFVNDAHYLSHLDSKDFNAISLESIAKAATVIARAAVAYAYDGGDGYYGSVEYAESVISDLDSENESLTDLANCLFEDGRCDTLKAYSAMERANSQDETGLNAGIGQALGTPPNYYVSVYDGRNGQAYAYINEETYGSYNGDTEYGNNSKDAVLLTPNVLEMGIFGLLNDYLGRGSSSSSSSSDEDLSSCKSANDCSSVAYCSHEGDSAVCSGSNVCVCSRSHYHLALDEAIVPAPNNRTGMFVISDSDEAISSVYSEPYWGSSIGVHVYRDGGGKNSGWAFGAGVVLAGAWCAATLFLKNRLRKEKLY